MRAGGHVRICICMRLYLCCIPTREKELSAEASGWGGGLEPGVVRPTSPRDQGVKVRS